MNTDIRLNVNVFSHPKIKKLRTRLGEKGVLAWIQILVFVGRERSSGTLAGLDLEDLRVISEYEGEIEARRKTLIELRLLDETPEGELAVHDWNIHNPWAANADARSAAARRANHKRWHLRRGRPEPWCLDCDGDPSRNPSGSREESAFSVSSSSSLSSTSTVHTDSTSDIIDADTARRVRKWLKNQGVDFNNENQRFGKDDRQDFLRQFGFPLDDPRVRELADRAE